MVIIPILDERKRPREFKSLVVTGLGCGRAGTGLSSHLSHCVRMPASVSASPA